ncbi:MAG: hypothetical protein PHF86_14655 [Candidatus Nanoarchaeia archaeon]|jgi:hypothetical protein|nr:hypothetical protein [Candidatus Nanoarchaeia archaeon]
MSIEKNIEKAKLIPKFFLGQQVTTKEGRGIIVELNMPTNGLYISPEQAQVTVWYGCDNDSRRWVQLIYSIFELEKETEPVWTWTPKLLNWTKRAREILQEINQGTVHDIVKQLQSKNFVPDNKYQTAYFCVQQTLWAMKSRKAVKKTGVRENAIWALEN